MSEPAMMGRFANGDHAQFQEITPDARERITRVSKQLLILVESRTATPLESCLILKRCLDDLTSRYGVTFWEKPK